MKTRKIKQVIKILIFLILLSAIIAITINKQKISKNDTIEKPACQVSVSPTVNPSQENLNKKYMKINALIKEESENFPGDCGIIFYDINTQKQISQNEKEVFESASLVKIPIMIEVIRQEEAGKIKLEDKLTLRESDKTGGAGSVKNFPAGTEISIEDLITHMITESDNTAADMLIEKVSMPSVEKTCQELGMKNTTLKRKIYAFEEIERGLDNVTTPEDMLVSLKYIYSTNDISKEHRDFMIEVLKGQKRNDIIPKNLPKGTTCAHKTGGLTGIVHDCGIIYPCKCSPYILVLLGKNVTDDQKAREVFSGISKKIYDIMTSER